MIQVLIGQVNTLVVLTLIVLWNLMHAYQHLSCKLEGSLWTLGPHFWCPIANLDTIINSWYHQSPPSNHEHLNRKYTVLVLPFLLHLQGASSMWKHKHCPSPVITADILYHSLIIASGDDDITREWGSHIIYLRSDIFMQWASNFWRILLHVSSIYATNLPKCSIN